MADVKVTIGWRFSHYPGTGGSQGTHMRHRRKRFLLILSARIFDSSVERASPRRAAAPEGPATRPPVARRASSTTAFSCAAMLFDNFSRPSILGLVDSQLSSIVKSPVSETITDR